MRRSDHRVLLCEQRRHTDRNSEEYYSNALPYLRSVESPWDAEVDSDHVSTMTCTKAELAALPWA